MKKRYIISFVVAIIILSVLFLWNVGAGSVDISTSDLFAILAGSGKDETFSQIVWKIRLPRILAAILLGGALSVSGFLLQSFFQNPIAGPYVLGISSGAKLVVALTMIFLLEKGIMISSFGMVMAAFVGSMLAMGFVLLISFRVSKMSLLVVCGIMIGYICSAITDFCVTFASDSNIVNLHNWSMGSFSGMSWEHIRIMVIIVGITVVITFGLAKPISAYQMGESYARNMGVNVKVLRIALILLSSQCKSIEGHDDPFIKPSVCLRDCICGTDLLCRNCSAASGEDGDKNSAPDYPDSGVFFVWCSCDTFL